MYNFLKTWLYLRLHPECDLPVKRVIVKAQEYFGQRATKDKRAFLMTEMGLQFAEVFKLLRLQYMLTDIKAIRLFEKDNILPRGMVPVLILTVL